MSPLRVSPVRVAIASLAVVLSPTFFPGANAEEPSPFSTLFLSAREAEVDRRFDTAAELLEAAIDTADDAEQTRPEFAEALGRLSNLRVRQGRYKDAVDPARRRLALVRRLVGETDREALEATSRVAQLCARAEEYEVAITLWHELIDLSVDTFGLYTGDAFIGLGHAYEDQRLYEEASANFERAVKEFEGRRGFGLVIALEGASRVQRELGNDQEAARLMARAQASERAALERAEKAEAD